MYMSKMEFTSCPDRDKKIAGNIVVDVGGAVFVLKRDESDFQSFPKFCTTKNLFKRFILQGQ